MDDQSTIPEPGGFIRQTGLPSPASSSASTRPLAGLPHPRGHSLRPGSSKEDMVRRYVEERLLHISRRYVKKFGNPNPGDEVVGFKSFGEVAKELDGLVNVLWKSGTPSLQIPFLLKLASDFTQYVRSFPPSPRATFELLRKLDHCFASLLRGQDMDTNETLPGFENGLRAGMTTTDMVRCRSLVEQTRVLIVEVLSSGDVDDEDDEDEDEDTDMDMDGGESAAEAGGNRTPTPWDIEEERLHMDAARIYENTIVQLGERLGDPLGSENKIDSSAVCSTAD
ncbi:meiotic recombination protein DMC1 [Metarhizium robertsii ARSEF 23]|uniref:Meiotic recombination protein DMC1 n=1 Tax=Metarhizium robertsii (strain ARSEF 23 / ATCC MYA-3075) TaxID=655844 RepID=E9EMS1_METRA|nr:meiotic recombination protein DMC1 [Metarhizium robertsii ARSEF 23]EFZ03265.1 meiotic recombination protein DMC1 [Metarhizium robertsii ARSEF 23]